LSGSDAVRLGEYAARIMHVLKEDPSLTGAN
jgi:hypothetical protein